jgi:MYXO-CTERM domain-containing protein
MARWLLALPLLVVVGTPGDAWALKPGTHRELAEAACTREGLPDAFCRRMGKQTYETDYQEWNDLSAHAQRELGEDRCTAADAALTRVDRLARDLVKQARAGQLEAAAVSLGRALHTIQDECAHHGMTNQEHAFYSLTQQCSGDQVSPDVQPAALACARTRTAEVMTLAARALADVSWGAASDLCTDWSSENQRDKCQNAALPSPFMACDFLGEHKDWDGDDSTWDPTKVGDALVASFGAGLTNTPSTRSMCGANASAIDPPNPRAPLTDRSKKLGCFSTSLGCLGKVDGGGESSDATSSGGCSTTSSSSAGLLVLALAFLAGRRRRAARRSVAHA